MKKYLISLISVLTALLIFCSVKTGIDFWRVFGLLKQSTSKADRVLCSTNLAEMASALILLLVCVNVLLMLLHKGTISEIPQKVQNFNKQLSDICLLVVICVLFLFVVNEILAIVALASSFAIITALILVGMNTVSLLKNRRESPKDSR